MAIQEEKKRLEEMRTEVFALVEAVRTGQCIKQLDSDRRIFAYGGTTQVSLTFPRANMHNGQYDIIVCNFWETSAIIIRTNSHRQNRMIDNIQLKVTADNRSDCEMFERMMRTVTRQDGDDADTKPARSIAQE